MPAASANSLVVVPANPFRAKSGTAAATIALRRSSLSNLTSPSGAVVSAYLLGVKPFLIGGRGGVLVSPLSSVQLEDRRLLRRYWSEGSTRWAEDGAMKLYGYFRSSAAFGSVSPSI